MTKRKRCKIDGCSAKIYTRGLCALHWCKRGDQADPMPPPAPPRSNLRQALDEQPPLTTQTVTAST